METRRREPDRDRAVSGEGGARSAPESAREPQAGTGAGRIDRFVGGAETGVRRFVRFAAVLLWIPFGFLFWIPFLVRRTVSYVFVVLYAGLTGGQTDGAERRWEQAVAFYQLGFQRILHAFRRDEHRPERPDRTGAEPEQGARRFVLESLWAVFLWGVVLWLVGLWPDAPGAVRSALLGAWEVIAGAGRRFDAWIQALLGR